MKVRISVSTYACLCCLHSLQSILFLAPLLGTKVHTAPHVHRQLLVELEGLEQSRRLEATAKKQQLSRNTTPPLGGRAGGLKSFRLVPLQKHAKPCLCCLHSLQSILFLAPLLGTKVRTAPHVHRQLLVELEGLEQSRRLEATAKKQQLSRNMTPLMRRYQP